MACTDPGLEYSVHRPVLDYGTFADTYRAAYRRRKPLLDSAADVATKACDCSSQRWRRRMLGLVPMVQLFRSGQYSRTDLLGDVIAGFTTCVFHIPQGLAYGMLAGLKPVNGLYTSLIPVLIFAVFGRSRHLSIGTFSLMALMLSDMIEANYESYLPRIAANSSLAMNYTETDYAKLQTGIVGTFAASIIIIVIGLLRLGFVMRYMSDAMLKGFTTAAAVQVVVSQLPLLLGVRPARTTSHFRIVASLINLFAVIGSTNFVTLGLSGLCCAVLYLVKEFVNPVVKKKAKVPVPIELIVIVVTLLAARFADMNDRFSVAIVGDVPRGLPSPIVPDLGFLPSMIPSAIPVGIVGSAITMSLAKLYCLQFQYSYDFNEDFAILGASSLVGSFFQCFFACGALARNSVVVSVGMKSQLASAISCLGMLLVLLVVGPFFETIPTCVLGSIIVVSLINVMRPVKELPRTWRASRVDFAVFVASGVAVLALDVTLGLAIGLGITLLSVVLRTQAPPTAELGRVADTDIYEDLLTCPHARPLPGLILLRFSAPINFANAETFADFVETRLGRPDQEGEEKNQKEEDQDEDRGQLHTVVLDCSAWGYIDMVGVRVIKETYRMLSERGIRVLLAACKDPVRASFDRQGGLLLLPVQPAAAGAADDAATITNSSTSPAFFVSVHDAVLFALHAGAPPANSSSPAVAAAEATARTLTVSVTAASVMAAVEELQDGDSEGLIINEAASNQDD